MRYTAFAGEVGSVLLPIDHLSNARRLRAVLYRYSNLLRRSWMACPTTSSRRWIKPSQGNTKYPGSIPGTSIFRRLPSGYSEIPPLCSDRQEVQSPRDPQEDGLVNIRNRRSCGHFLSLSAFNNRCADDNTEILKELVKLRKERVSGEDAERRSHMPFGRPRFWVTLHMLTSPLS